MHRSAQGTVDLHDLVFLDDGDEVVVGRRDIDSYGAFPPDGAALLRRLVDGETVPAAGRWYAQTYGEQPDLDAFVATLTELDFVKEPALVAPAPDALAWQGLGRAVYSLPGLVAWLALLAAAVVLCADDPRLAPRASHVFFTSHLSVVQLVVLLGQVPLIALHELSHVLAGRRLGLRTRVRLSYRFLTPVVETRLDGLVSVPRGQRVLPVLAGLLTDAAVVAALTVAAAASRRADGSVPLWGGVCLALAFTTMPRIAWQFFLHLRTDVYHLFVLTLGCDDLHAASRHRLTGWYRTLRGRAHEPDDGTRWSARTGTVARWYAPLLLVGYAASLATVTVLVLPLAWRFFGTALDRTVGSSTYGPPFWDAAVVLVLTSSELLLAGALAWRERRRSRPPSPAGAAP